MTESRLQKKTKKFAIQGNQTLKCSHSALLLFTIMLSFSNRCSHKPLGQASQGRVGRLLWNPIKEGYGGGRGQGGGEGVLRDGEFWSAILRCEVKQGSSSFSEQGELLWDLFFIVLYFCCLDPARCPRASGVLDQHWPKSWGSPYHGHHCSNGIGLPAPFSGE